MSDTNMNSKVANEIQYHVIFNAINKLHKNGEIDNFKREQLIISFAEKLDVLPYAV